MSEAEAQRTRQWCERLSYEYDHLLFSYKVKLRKPVLAITENFSVWGRWDGETRTLEISRRLIETYPWESVIEILKHEIAHQMVNELYHSDELHGPLFQEACRRLSVSAWARKAEGEIKVQSALDRPEEERTPEEKRLMGRVEKLLALANSSNEHEAFLAMRKVQELYSKYNLDRLSGTEKSSDYVYLALHTGKRRLERYYYAIASLLNDHFFVEIVHTSLYNAKACREFRVVELMGTRENVKMAEYVYHFLLNQLEILWGQYRKQAVGRKRARGSYYLGVLSGFRQKLEAARTEVSELTGTALIVPNDPHLRTYMKERHPRITWVRHGSRRGDGAAYTAGQKDGRALNLRRGLAERGIFKGLLIGR